MICPICGSVFVKTSNSQKYCCESCKATAKKLQDSHNSHVRYNCNKTKKPKIVSVCEYCGKEFTKQHGNQKYCCKKCAKNKNRELNADASNKHYHRVKKLRGGDTVWGLGSGSLGAHMHNDWQVEREKIENEMRRLRLSAK